MQDRQKGSFYGLGILVTKRNDQVTVITPLEGTPAARLGIRAGDVISEVEGVSTDDLPLDDVVKRLKGPKDTTVHIKILRVGIKEPIPLTIVRAAIPTNSISNVLMLRPASATSASRTSPRPRCASSTRPSTSSKRRGCRSSSSISARIRADCSTRRSASPITSSTRVR
jgi:hypothetical protein